MRGAERGRREREGLAIDRHGGFDLDRYARTLTDEGMTVRYTRRIENDLILTIEGRLEAAGG